MPHSTGSRLLNFPAHRGKMAPDPARWLPLVVDKRGRTLDVGPWLPTEMQARGMARRAATPRFRPAVTCSGDDAQMIYLAAPTPPEDAP